MTKHIYKQTIEWTGNNGIGTQTYESYARDFDLMADHRDLLSCSADPAFRGDATKYNPEDFLLCSVSSCHMLWFLHLCADKGIVVMNYTDQPVGEMESIPGKGGKFIGITLNPIVKITDPSRIDEIVNVHEVASEKCFISNSLNFEVVINSQCFAV